MTQIKRWGTYITNVHLNPDVLNDMDWEYWKQRFRKYEDTKVVYRVPIGDWSEGPCYSWFMEHYSELGFSEILQEKTELYMKHKEEMKFYGYPDFLVERGNGWERLEVEAFGAFFQTHPGDYAEYLVCFDNQNKYSGVTVYTIREFYGCEEIVNYMEIPEFLYLYDTEFKEEYRQRMWDQLKDKMTPKRRIL